MKTNGEVLHVDNPEFLPDPSVIEEIREPDREMLHHGAERIHLADCMQLIMDKRGIVDHTEIARHPPRDAHLRAAAE